MRLGTFEISRRARRRSVGLGALLWLVVLALVFFAHTARGADAIIGPTNGHEFHKVSQIPGLAQGEFIDRHYATLTLIADDLVMRASGGFDVKLRRVYNASTEDVAKSAGLLGTGWQMHFGAISRGRHYASAPDMCSTAAPNVSENLPIFAVGDGTVEVFHLSDDGVQWESPNRWRMFCDAASVFIHSPEGIRYEARLRGPSSPYGAYDQYQATTYYVTSVVNASDFKYSINYHSTAQPPYNCAAGDFICAGEWSRSYQVRIKQVISNEGEVLFDFTYKYSNSNPSGAFATWVLSSVTDGVRTVTYDVTESREGGCVGCYRTRLNKVSIGNRTLDQYSYVQDASRRLLLTTWRNRYGGEVGYEYVLQSMQLNYGPCAPFVNRQLRVLQRRAEGETWNINMAIGEFNVPDLTTFTLSNPSVTYEFKHFGYSSVFASSAVPNSSCPAFRLSGSWRYGLMESMRVRGVNPNIDSSVTYRYEPRRFSAAAARGPFSPSRMSPAFYVSSVATYIEPQTDFPVLVSQTILRDGVVYNTSYSDFTAFRSPQYIVETSSSGTRYHRLTYFTQREPVLWIIDRPKNHTTSFQGIPAQ